MEYNFWTLPWINRLRCWCILWSFCLHPLINGCCNTDLDCTKGNKCSSATCPTPGGFCQGGMIPGCCNGDADCKDPKNPVCDRPTGRCVSCSPTNDRCPAGEYCGVTNGKNGCLPGCKNDEECKANGTLESRCCDHACVDTAFDDMQTAVEAVRLGALDHLGKPLDLAQLDEAIAKAFAMKALSEKGFAFCEAAELDYRPQISVGEGTERFFAWYRDAVLGG